MLKYRFLRFANVLIARQVYSGGRFDDYSVIQIVIIIVCVDCKLSRVILWPVESNVRSVLVVSLLLGIDWVELLSKLLKLVEIAYSDRSTGCLQSLLKVRSVNDWDWINLILHVSIRVFAILSSKSSLLLLD